MEVVKFKGGFDRNFRHVIYDIKSKEAIVIDPFPIDNYFIKTQKLGLKIIGVLNTHSHFDHISGNEFFKRHGINLIKNEKVINLGDTKIKVIETPGHSKDSVCFYADEKLFTGDTLFVGGIGASFNKEDEKQEFESLKKIIKLPDETINGADQKYGRRDPPDHIECFSKGFQKINVGSIRKPFIQNGFHGQDQEQNTGCFRKPEDSGNPVPKFPDGACDKEQNNQKG